MPIIFRCSRCGYVLHVFVRVGQNSYGVPTPSELANQYGGVCPRCGKPLNTKPSVDDIRIYTDLRKFVEAIEEAKKTMRIGFRSISKTLEEYLASLNLYVPTGLEAGEVEA